MKLGIVIACNIAETVWNAFRLGVHACQQGDTVKIFLLGQGVESETLQDAKFNVVEQMKSFVEQGGEILACGTCLEIRQSESSALCPVSTMADLHQIVNESDKVLTF
ncbi:DsrE family protein [Thiohalophilus sp.]|uniref:DsrE family protein n=1 Tax=Thiohalophilus sp. TaxID=3028392 RepID=UPI002ACDA914|nr:DsrE family protein [Thiohalophilus sp.]MDZ7662967.1 DsrE family protein [Thiohalophilus sp.]